MSNKRNLKKRVEQLCGAAAVQIMLNFPDAVAQKFVVKLARLQSLTINKISFSFDRARRDYADDHQYNKARRAYNREAYTRLKNDFNKELQAIVDEINALRKSEKN